MKPSFLFGKDLILVVCKMTKQPRLFISVQNPTSKARELRNRQDESLELSPKAGGYSHCKYEDYSFIDFHRKAFESTKIHPTDKKYFYSELIYYGAHRDYHGGSIQEFKSLSQIGTPDHELQEPKWELFKITMSDITRSSPAGRFRCECVIFTVSQDKEVFYINSCCALFSVDFIKER